MQIIDHHRHANTIKKVQTEQRNPIQHTWSSIDERGICETRAVISQTALRFKGEVSLHTFQTSFNCVQPFVDKALEPRLPEATRPLNSNECHIDLLDEELKEEI
ncbi:hypothetical protein CEXT_20481 [Caerostris extrusa]|uniref:Uncharacterized protein n=1 Tax=Caerostris extrusa TaxID=172846 RepID=A0AAV4WSL1_CAEEX|nr:hypothetical protein CEXT_20481 [Caerostris extrusa]